MVLVLKCEFSVCTLKACTRYTNRRLISRVTTGGRHESLCDGPRPRCEQLFKMESPSVDDGGAAANLCIPAGFTLRSPGGGAEIIIPADVESQGYAEVLGEEARFSRETGGNGSKRPSHISSASHASRASSASRASRA